jgi:hypothetical protein
MAMPEEYAIVRKAGITAPNIAYFLSRSVLFNGNTVLKVLIWRMNITRVGTFGSTLGTFLGGECVPCIFKVDRMICLVIVIPLDNCEIVKYTESVFAVIALPATSLLFFFRLKAVYRHSTIIITIFGIFWLAIAGLSILLTFSIRISE